MAQRPRLTPLLKDTEVLGQEQIDNTSLPTQQDRRAPLKLRPDQAPAPTIDVMGSPEVYDPFGENYAELDSNIRPEKNLEAQLAEEQGGSRWLNALGQFANEVVLGTVSGTGMLVDFLSVGETVSGEENDFGNWFSDAVDKVKEDLNKEMPTYRSEEAQTGWAPFDGTWWADNMATIGTTLSLMVPVAGAMRIPGAIGKLMRGAAAGSKVARGAKSSSKVIRGLNKALYGTESAGMLQQGGSAIISRHLESTMEAHETFKNVEQQLLAKGFSEEEARAQAGEAASNVYSTNWLNIAQDFFQYRTLSKGMSAANKASKEFRKGLLSSGGEFLKTMASEGVEELGQYVIGQEAERAALDDRKSYFELSGLGSRLYDYIQEPEAKAAMLLGAAGGGVFHAISSTPEIYGRLSGTYDAQEASLAKQTALDQMDINTSYLVDGTTLLNQAIKYAGAGRLNDLRTFYSDLAETSDRELEEQGFSPEEIADKRKKDAQILEDIDLLGDEFSRIVDDTSKSGVVKMQELGAIYEKHKLTQAKGDINEALNKETEKVKDQISEQKLNIKRNGFRLDMYKNYRELYKSQQKGKVGADKVLEQIDKKIELLEKELTSAKESLASSTTETSDIPSTTRDLDILGLEKQSVLNEIQDLETDRTLQNTSTVEGQKELENEHDQREIQETLDKVTPNSDMKFLKALTNPNNKTPKGWDKIKGKLKSIADKGEVDLAPPLAGSESFEEDLAKRYANTPLLMRELAEMKKKLTSEQDHLDLKKVLNAEQFSNLYANNKNVAAAFDALMEEKKSKYVKADLKGQIDPETTFVDPENPNDNTPTENPEPVIYTPEGDLSKPGEAMIFSNAVVLYTYNAKTGIVKFSGLENHKEPMELEDAIELMDSLGYDSRFISSTRAQGAYRVLLTSDGQAIPSEFNSVKINGESVKLLSDEELKIINDPESKLLGGKIKFSVPRDADVNKDPSTTADNFLIVLSTEIEVDGEIREVKVGTLGATKKGANNTDAVKRLRDTIFTEFKQSELQPAPTTTTQQTSGLVPNTNVIGLESDYSGDQFNVYVYTEDGNGKPIDLGFTLPSELTGKETWKVTVSVNTGRTDGKNPFLHSKAFDKTFNSREEAEKYAQSFIKQDKSKVDTTTASTTEGQPGVFTSSVDNVIIGDRTRGLFNSGWSKPSVPVHDALGDDFAMGVVNIDANDNVVFITKNIERHIEDPKKISNGNASFFKNHKGNLIAYVKTAKGLYIPVRLQTTKLKNLPTEQNAVHDIINEFFDAYDNGELTPKPKSTKVKGVNIAEDNQAVYAKVKEFNKKLLGYIPMRLAINTTIGGKLVLSTRKDAKGNNILDSNPITREEALEYANGKTMRIDEKKINTGDYNKELSEKGWVTVNLDIESPMVGSDVVAKIGSLPVAPQIKGVTDVAYTPPTQPTATPTDTTEKSVFLQKENLSKAPPFAQKAIKKTVEAISEDVRLEVVKKAYEGLTATPISKELGLTTEQVRSIRTYYGVPDIADKVEYAKWKDNISKQLATSTPTAEPSENPLAVIEKMDEVMKNSSFIKLSEDEKTYVNTITGQVYQRVTSYISGGKEIEETPVLKSSQIIGNKVDIFIRDFFAGELKALETYDLVDDIETIENFVKQLESIKEGIDARGEKILANDIVLYNDEIGVAGTVDLISIDKDGVVRIYDVKSKRSGVSYIKSTKFGKSDLQKWTDQLSLYRILLNNTHGIKAKTLGVLPVKVQYQGGDEISTELELLKGIGITAKDKVVNAEMSKPKASSVKTVSIAKDANSNFTVNVNMKDGSVTFTENGNPLDSKKDLKLINKAHLRSGYISYEVFPYNNQVYAITSDNRIINITPDGKSIGAEVTWKGPVGKAIRQSQEETVPNEPETKEVPNTGGAIDFSNTGPSSISNEDADDNIHKRFKEASDPEGSHEKWDEEKETAWFKKNYPNVPFEVLDDLREIAGKGPNRYWGVFTNASVFISKQAKAGTAYHEAFHAVFNLMLNDNERAQIIKEGSSFAKGAINIEEHWADEFIEYQLSDGNTAHTLPEKVADFFKRLWNIIKIITERTGLTKPASMNDYMYRVSRGLYNNGLVKKFGGVNFKRDITRFSKQTENKSDYLNIREEEIGKRVMNAILINDILPVYRDFFKIPDASNGDVIKRVISEGMKRKDPSLSIAGLYKNVYEIIETRRDKTTNSSNKQLLDRFLNSIGTTNEATGGIIMKPLFARAARALSHYGIKMSITLNTLTTTNDNLGEDMLLEENEELIENWMVKEKFISNKEKFSQKAKALFAQVPLRGEKFGGFDVYEQPSHVFNKLTSKLSSSRSFPDMMSKLDQLAKFNPAYKVIQEALKDPTLASDFWKNMGQRSFTPFLSMTSEKGKSRTFVGNSEDSSKDITERWTAEFRDSSMYDAKDSKVIPPKDFGKKVAQLEALKDGVIKDVQNNPLDADGNISREDALKLSNILKVIKMPIPHAEVVEMFSNRDAGIENTTGGKDRFVKFATALVNHMKTIERGADPFSGTIESNKYLTDIVGTYLDVFPTLYQKTFRSGTNELIYSMLQSRFMQKMERELKNPTFKEREEFIKNYMEDPFYRNSPFFKALIKESIIGDKMNIAVFDALKTDDSKDGIEYSKLTPQQLEAVKINAFFNQQFDSVKESTDYGYFMMPVLSDSTSAAFMYFKKYEIAEARVALIESAKQERDRIEWLNSRVDPVREDYNKWLADQFNKDVKHKDKAPLPKELKDIPYSILKNGLKYQIFTELNTTNINISTEKGFEEAVMKMVSAAIKSESQLLMDEGILKTDENGDIVDATGAIDGRFLDPDTARENIKAYLYNTMLMNIQSLVTFGGDVAFYKSKDGDVDFTDVYKRIKEIWSPGDYLHSDVSNEFTYTSDEKSETVTVSDTYGTLYVTDPAVVDDVVSKHIDFIKKVHKDNPRKDEIVKEFKDLNETDAATIIDPIRAREIELGVRGLTNEKYEFYESLMESGKPIRHVGSDHINVVYKPFQFFHNKVTDPLGTTRMNPTQHKNAEFLVTPAMAVGNPKLEKAMEKFGYSFNEDGSWTYDPNNRITDSIMFTTAVKVGEVGSVDSIDDATSEDVQEFYNSDYRIQMETPEHHIDTDVIEGVQYRKLIIENVDPKLDYTLPDGTTVKGAKLQKDYNEAIYLNVKEGYDNLKKEFYDEETGLPDNEKIINALREQVIEQEKPEDMLRALDWLDVNKGMEIGPNGDLIQSGRETVLPLWHPDIVYQVESMMNSFFKKKIAKQKTEKGGGASLYNASSYGLSAENPKGYRKPEIVLNDEGGIAYFEAIMPVTMSALEEYADENGLIDITKIEGIDEDILKGVFYRIPTEHKYSMFHIKVIGFLPAGVGGQIILPEEATTIAGLDFDIDKLYGLLYNIEEYGKPLPEKEMEYQIWKNTPSYSPKAGKDIVRADIDNFDDTRGRREFAASQENVRWNKNDDQFTEKPTLRKIPSGMETKASRDNLKLDLATAVLTNKRTAEETLTPGGFKTIEETVDFILELSGQTKGKLNPMLNSTGREVFNRNMTGLDLIGMFANHTANHALMTLGNVEFPIYKEKLANGVEKITDYGIKFNGKTLRSLSEMKVGDVSIMDLKQFLAAAVDNGKNPLASFLNLTTVTADTVATMVRVGFPIESVLMFSANPALKKMTMDLSIAGNTYSDTQDQVIDDQMSLLMKGVAKIMFPKGVVDFDKIDAFKNSIELTFDRNTKEGTLTDSIKKSNKTIEDLIKDKDATELMTRLKVLQLYRKTSTINAEPLSQIMGQMRYDSSGNAAGPTIAHNKSKELKHQKLDKIVTITGWESLLANNSGNPAQHVAAFYEYGIREANRITGEVTEIPYANSENNIFNIGLEIFMEKALPADRSMKPEDINQFYRAIETMLGTSYPTFKLKEMRRVIETLPSRLKAFENENPDSPYTTFLRHFNPQSSKVVKFKILRFNRNGVDPTQKQEMKSMLLEMLNDTNEEVSELAHDLIKYAFATTGYIETPYKFTDLIPADYTSTLQEDGEVRYVEHLKTLYNKDFDYLGNDKDSNTINNILDQIIRNRYRHLSLKYIDLENPEFRHVITNNVLEVLIPMQMMGSTGEKTFLQYAKTAYEKNGKMTSVPIKFTGEVTEGNEMVFKEIARAGADNEILEMSYDDAVNDIPLISEIESYDYIPTEAEKNANFSKVPLNQVSAAEVLLSASELLPGLSFENIEKLSSANRATHPFMIALNNLSLPQRQQLRDIVGGKSTNSNSLLNKLIELSNKEVPMPPAAEVSTDTTQPTTATTGDTNITSPKNKFSITPIEGRPDKKATPKSKIATQYIGFAEGIKNSSTANYAEQAGEFANTGNYGPNDVIFVSIGGNRGTAQLQKSQQDRTIKEAIKAVEAGATIITDNKAYIDSKRFLIGEKRLYKNMEAKGYNYSEITVDGQTLGTWSKSTQPTTAQPTSEGRKYTPENITSLEPNQVFVFGANTAGGHGGGTAGLAQRGNAKSNYTALPQGTKGKWAEYGVVDQLMEGNEGKSFGIVTKAASVSGTKLKIGGRRSVPLERIEQSINSLIETANNNPELEFLVTKFGTNMAGFTVAEMKSLLEGKSLPDNIVLPKEFETRPAQPTTPAAVSTTFKDTFTIAEQQTIIENFALKYLNGDEVKALDYINDAFSKTNDTTVKVISGGQTGVDQIGLIAATEMGIETGGTAPKGFRTESGNDESLADFGLSESSSSGYPARTEDNVRNSDGTVYYAVKDKATGKIDSAGYRTTKAFAEKHGKPFIVNPNESVLREWVKQNNVATLNVAGNRASKMNSKQLENIKVILRKALTSSDSIINKLKECY